MFRNAWESKKCKRELCESQIRNCSNLAPTGTIKSSLAEALMWPGAFRVFEPQGGKQTALEVLRTPTWEETLRFSSNDPSTGHWCAPQRAQPQRLRVILPQWLFSLQHPNVSGSRHHYRTGCVRVTQQADTNSLRPWRGLFQVVIFKDLIITRPPVITNELFFGSSFWKGSLSSKLLLSICGIKMESLVRFQWDSFIGCCWLQS